jgi:hypothetical protein
MPLGLAVRQQREHVLAPLLIHLAAPVEPCEAPALGLTAASKMFTANFRGGI